MPEQITLGANVVTSDGKQLGRVKELTEKAFRVDAPRQFDYWLFSSLAGEVTGEQVTLTVTESELGAYKMDNPHDHNEFMAEVPDKMKPGNVRDSVMRQRR
ncbi:MAG: hypothetical protein AB7J35_00450 [Dehalococcoidia bacterium]